MKIIHTSDWHLGRNLMYKDRKKEHAEFLGASITQVVKVPGVFDMGLAIKKLIQRNDIDGVISLGAVIEGETEHDELVISHASRKIADLSVEFEKPIGLGISGPGMTRLQAQDRIDRAKAAVEAVVKLHRRLNL